MTKERYDVPVDRLKRLSEVQPDLIKRINRQLVRWFELDPRQLHISQTGFSAMVGESSPPEWVLLLTTLQGGSPNSIDVALKEVEKTRKSDITRRLGNWRPKVLRTELSAE
jgi:hypothetical protein